MIDNNDLFDIWDRECTAAEEKRQKCEHCGEPIWDDYAYDLPQGLFCESCLIDLFRISID